MRTHTRLTHCASYDILVQDYQPGIVMHTQCRHCETNISIKGDGSHAYIADAVLGGLYFCNHRCKEAWRTHNVRHSLSGMITGIGNQPIPFSSYDEYQNIIKAQYR